MESGHVAHGAKMAHDVHLDAASIALLDKLQERLPPPMPKAVRLRLIDKICMQGAVLTRQRGDTTISVDDLMVGIHQTLAPDLIGLICARLEIGPEKIAEYRQRALKMAYVSVADFLKDLKVIAEKCGAEVREDKLFPVLDCYRDAVEHDTIYIKTTTKDVSPREFFVRPGHSERWLDLAALAKAYGLIDLYDNPAYQAYASVCATIPISGSMIDVSTRGDIQKFYAYFTHDLQPISAIRDCQGLPESLFKNAALLESLGFGRFAIFGVDFEKNSLNVYYYTELTEFNREKIIAIFTALGFQLPSEDMLEQMVDAALVYFTFTHTSDRIARVCFTRIYEDSMEEALAFVPSFKEYIENSPIQAAKRNLLLGFTFTQRGHYLKVELDYRASLCIPKKMKYTGLYSDPADF